MDLWSWAGRVTVVTTPRTGGATNVNGEQPPCCTYQELHASRGKENERLTCSNQMLLHFLGEGAWGLSPGLAPFWFPGSFASRLSGLPAPGLQLIYRLERRRLARSPRKEPRTEGRLFLHFA